MSIDVEWVDALPPRGPGNTGSPMEERYAAHLEALRSRPGKWARIAASVPKTQATQLNKRTKGFEFVNRNFYPDPTDPKARRTRCDLFGRFLLVALPGEGPTTPPVAGAPFLKCRSGGCGFTCDVTDMPALTRHVKDRHDRVPTQAERQARRQ